MRVCVEQRGPLTAPNPQGGRKVPTWGRDGCPDWSHEGRFPRIKIQKKNKLKTGEKRTTALHIYTWRYFIWLIKPAVYLKIQHYNSAVNIYIFYSKCIKKEILTCFHEAPEAALNSSNSVFFPKRKPATQYSLPAFREPHLNFPHTLSQSLWQWPKIHRKNIKGLTVVKGKGRWTKPTPPRHQHNPKF